MNFKLINIKSEFTKSVLTLMTSTTIAQFIPVIISPILTRLYKPEDFGLYALYMAIVSIISVLATLRYELAIILPRKDENAINVMALAIIISIFLCLTSFVIISIFNKKIANLLGKPEISIWLYIIPITVLFVGTYQSFNYWLNRKKKYKDMAAGQIIKSITNAIFNLSAGLGRLGCSGLILGQVLGQSIATAFLGRKTIKNNIKNLHIINKSKIFAMAKKYVKFPKFDFPSSFIYTIYANLSIIFFNKFFEASVAGFYILTNRIIKTPVNLYVTAFSNVFYQKLSTIREYHLIAKEINYFTYRIFKCTSIPYFFIVYSSKIYIDYIFGKSWHTLYQYIIIFSIPTFCGLLSSPYGHVLKVINRQEVSFWIHFLRLLILGTFFISYFFIKYDLISFLFFYAVIDTTLQLINSVIIDVIIRNPFTVRINLYKVILFLTLAIINLYMIR